MARSSHRGGNHSLVLLLIKSWFGYDDALDTFGVHAVGGTLGALLTGMLARHEANANLATNLKDKITGGLLAPLVFEQIKAIVVTMLLAIVGAVVIAYIVKAVMGLRRSEREWKSLVSTWPTRRRRLSPSSRIGGWQL